MTSIEFRGWESVTDVPCLISGCVGELRWAEAGYVPGYRICDCCGSHYALRDGSLRLVRRLRPSPAKIERMYESRAANQKAQASITDDLTQKEIERYTSDWNRPLDRLGVHGTGSYEVVPYYSGTIAILPEEYRNLVARCAAITTRLPAKARVISSTRDGSAVLVYAVRHDTDPRWDGWWSTEGLIAVIEGAPGWRNVTPGGWRSCWSKWEHLGKLTPEQQQVFGVFR